MAFDLTKPSMTDADWPTFAANIRENIRAMVQDFGIFTLGLPPERSRLFRAGERQDVAFSAGNFTANTGTFVVASGDQTSYAYTLIGDKMTLSVSISTATVTGSPANLRVAIPTSKTGAVQAGGGGVRYYNGTSWNLAMWRIFAGGTVVLIELPAAATFTNNTDATYLEFTIDFFV
jgi:hypothetical protein